MLTSNRLVGCAIAMIAISTSGAAAQEGEPAPSTAAPKSAVGSFSGASSTPAPTPAPDLTADAPPPATAEGASLTAPEDSSAGASSPGSVRTFSSAKAEGGSSPAGMPASRSLYDAGSRVRISIPRYTVDQVSRSIMRLRVAAIRHASMPALSAKPGATSEQHSQPDAPPSASGQPAPLAATPVE